MTTLKNINADKATEIYAMTGFNYDITTKINDDGTEDITFDSPADAAKFQALYNGVSEKPIQIVTETGTIVSHNYEAIIEFLASRDFFITGFYTEQEIYSNFIGSRWHLSRVWDWQIGAPKINGLCGPMHDGGMIRFETQEVNNRLSV